MTGIFLTILSGFSILIGTLIAFILKNNKKLTDFSISMAAGVMSALLIMELIPESFELLGEQFSVVRSILIIIISSLIGIVLLKTLDLFIPDHDHDEEINSDNLFHIGLVSSIALILHNLIEGMAIYSSSLTGDNIGILLTIGICLHNIPLGIMITSTLYKSNNNRKKTILIITLIAFSTLLGGILMFLLSKVINDVIRGILLSVTLGMILYIVLFEFIPEIKTIKNKKLSIFGIVLGIIIFLITLLFE